jgi:hypothetical protein
VTARPVDRAGFAELFHGFADSAFRLETLPAYREPHERDAVRRFLAGKPPDDSWMADYLDLLRELRRTGRALRRVRVLDVPPTDYQRFVQDLAARRNVPAGEELRVLDRDAAEGLGVREGGDFWLFDGATAAVMRFDGGAFAGAEIITAPDLVAGYRALRDRTWNAAREFTTTR